MDRADGWSATVCLAGHLGAGFLLLECCRCRWLRHPLQSTLSEYCLHYLVHN